MLALVMVTITIRRLDEATIEALRDRAKAGGRSMEEEARRILSRAVKSADARSGKLPPGEETIARFRELRERLSEGQTFDSVKDLRELRDAE